MRVKYARKSEQHQREAESLDRALAAIIEREAQIQRAQTEKLDAFDHLKFHRKRK
jgi:hypothetical protein